MKKMLLLTALALLITGCITDVYCSKQTGGSSTRNITHHFFVSGIGQKKTVDAAKFVAAQKMLLKQKQQTFVNGLLGFIAEHLYSAGSACACAHNNCMSCPSIWATLSAAH